MRVLVVEDEPSVSTGVQRALTAAGYSVDVAADGEVGLGLALAHPYEMIILDIMLPKINGYRICRHLREAGVTTAIMMLTAKGGEWDIAEGLDLGADDYLTKPFSMVVLLARVRARTRDVAGTATDAPYYSSGDLRLDVESRRCTRGRVHIDLTGRETNLLLVLFQRRDEIVTKADLLELVWGPDFSGDPNVVEVYVGRLRRKMTTMLDADDIETVRGVGYRLRASRSPGRAR